MSELMEIATQFGAAGLMGALWMWERVYSRRRENELTEAHEKIVAKDQRWELLIETLRQNTTATIEFRQMQTHHTELLKEMHHALTHTQHTQHPQHIRNPRNAPHPSHPPCLADESED